MMKRKKVLHLLWDGHLGGVQRYLLKLILAPYWEECFHHVCLLDETGVVLSEKSLKDVPLDALGIKSGWQLRKERMIKKVVDRVRPDIIHCHCDSPIFHLYAHHYKKIPLVFTEHGDTMMRTQRTLIGKLLWRLQKGSWKLVICNSYFVLRDFKKRYHWLTVPQTVIHNPLLEIYSKPLNKNISEQIQVAVFARLVPQKGIDTFLEVAFLVHQKCSNVRFNVFGEGPLEKMLLDHAKKLGIGNIVYFRGYTDDPLTQMAAMDINVIPSRIEPFGLVAVESQSVGTPVVSFLDSGVAELVVNEETGFLVEKNNIKQMAASILLLIRNPKMREQMGKRAIEHVVQNFSLQKHVNTLEQKYLALNSSY